MTEPPDLETYRAMLDEHGINEDTLVADDDGTICGSRSLEADLTSLPVLVGCDQPELELTGTLGKGGMGTIHLAQQRSLHRDVAVKQAHQRDGEREEAAATLIAEGRVTGGLEHPNIPPVHMLGVNDAGDVVLVMKRIEGTAWSKLLKERSDPGDDVERHVRILMEVCEAVAFAHDRGIVHRDIKPTNVMVGPFDEVYLLDWGLAVGVSEMAPAGVPQSSDVSDVVGTPAYMAPEMANPEGIIDERTDGYLLGAVLHKVITGKAPHKKKDIITGMHAAFTSAQLTFDDDVPEEIADICRRAMAREKDDRFGSVREFRAALDAFLQHKSARELSAEAAERLALLHRAASGEELDELEVQRAFTEARFGFQQALRVWPESPVAQAGLEDALLQMATFELANERYDSAALILAQHPSPPPALAARVDSLKEKAASQAEDLQVLRAEQRELDTRVGQRARAFVVFAIGAGWLALDLVSGILWRAGVIEPSVAEITVAQVVVLIGLTVVVVLRRERLLRNKASRNMMVALYTTILGCLSLEITAWVLELSLATMLGLAHIVMWVAVATSSVSDRRVWPAVIILPAGFAIPWFPRWALEINGVVLFLALAGIAWRLWGEEPEEEVD
jgi:serine/threonine-protein kinase